MSGNRMSGNWLVALGTVVLLVVLTLGACGVRDAGAGSGEGTGGSSGATGTNGVLAGNGAGQDQAAQAAAGKADKTQDVQGTGGGTGTDKAGQADTGGDVEDPAAQAAAEQAAAAAAAAAEAEAKAKAKAKAEAEAKAAEERRIKALVVALPEASPASGVFKGSVKVSLSCATPEAKLAYTLDGSQPVAGSSAEYTGPVVIGTSTLLRVLAWVPGGNVAEVQNFDYTLDELCVNGGGTGDGTRSRPLGRLARGVELAKTMGISLVKLGPDTLNESLELTEPLTYSGGWDRSFAKKTGKRSVIAGTAMEGGNKKTPGYGLKLAGSKVAAGSFEGLEVRGGPAGYSAGVLLTDKTAPTFTNCAFVGGEGNYGYGAVVLGQAAPIFVRCSLDGGASPSSYGISVDSASVTLQASLAFAGGGTVTGAGVMVTDGKITASNSVLAGNVANTGYGLALYNSKGSRIEACTLSGGSGRDATALFVSVGDPVLSSCILAARGKKVSYGVHDNYGDSAPAALKNVLFAGCATALYYDVDSKTLYTALDAKGALLTAAGKALAKPLAPGSLVQDLALGEVPFLRTPADAGAMVTGGGLPATAGTVDAGGNKRTEPWCIGAWEVEP